MIIYIIGRQTLPTTVSKADTSYWLASRYLGYGYDYVAYNARNVNTDGNNSSIYYLYDSYGNSFGVKYGVRPVVYLKSTAKLSNYSSTNGYTLSY